MAKKRERVNKLGGLIVNLLEHYIIEIHSEKEIMGEWMMEEYVKVDITIGCYGNIERKMKLFPLLYWEDIKKHGYYMA